MPRITAATVVEHRAAQRRALLDAARDILAETGSAPSLAAMGARTGLARSSVYQYFASGAAVLEAVVEDTFPRWSDRITAAMDTARTPDGRVMAYVAENLRLVADGEHAIARALAASADEEALARSSSRMHEALRDPLLEALRDQGSPDPAVTAELVNAVVFAGARLIEQGTALDVVLSRTTELLGFTTD